MLTTKKYLRIFRKKWCREYAKKFSNMKSYSERKTFKDDFYRIVFLTEDEKDEAWEFIMNLCSRAESDKEK